jgi:hypothetical protein
MRTHADTLNPDGRAVSKMGRIVVIEPLPLNRTAPSPRLASVIHCAPAGDMVSGALAIGYDRAEVPAPDSNDQDQLSPTGRTQNQYLWSPERFPAWSKDSTCSRFSMSFTGVMQAAASPGFNMTGGVCVVHTDGFALLPGSTLADHGPWFNDH